MSANASSVPSVSGAFPPGRPPLDLILGPILLGVILNVFFYGIMVLQCYLYYLNYKKKDRVIIKLTVVLLLLLDTISCIFDIQAVYNYLVQSFGNFSAIGLLNVGLTPYPLLTGIISFVVQCFFAWRIAILTKMNFLAIGIVILSIVQMLASIGSMIGGIIVQHLDQLTRLKSVSLIWLIGSAVTDLMISAILVIYLRQQRTGFVSTDDMISKIIRGTVQTGLITSACAIAVVIAFFVSDTSMHLLFGLPLSKLYTNSLMSMLNMRQGWNTSGITTLSQLNSTGRLADVSKHTSSAETVLVRFNNSRYERSVTEYELDPATSPLGWKDVQLTA